MAGIRTLYISVMLLLLISSYHIAGFNITKIGTSVIYDSPLTLHLKSTELNRLTEGVTQDIYFNYTIYDEQYHVWKLCVKIKHTGNAEIVGENEIILGNDASRDFNQTKFSVKGIFLGRTLVEFFVQPVVGGNVTANNSTRVTNLNYDHDQWQKLPDTQSLRVAVIRRKRALDHIFTAVISIFVLLTNIGMGCKVDLGVVKAVLKRPFAPVIGLGCQFVFMPLLSFGIVKLLGLRGGVALGFFAMGCAPGGGASNIYTFLLDGDVSLSVTMTLVSTFVSLGMIPFWIFTLGRLLIDSDTNINIPFQNIAISLIIIIVPVAIGIFIQRKRPLWAKQITKILKPIFLLFLIFMFSFGLYVNLYIFKLFTPTLILAGCLLPYCGFTLGGICSFICRQPKARIIAICIETGIQNPGVAILLMKFSLPQPDSDLSLVSPVVTSTFTPIPLLIAVAIYYIHKKCPKKPEFQEVPHDEAANTEEEMEDFSDKKILQNNNVSEKLVKEK